MAKTMDDTSCPTFRVRCISALFGLQLLHDVLVPWLYLLRITDIFPNVAHIEKGFFSIQLLLAGFLLSFWWLAKRKIRVFFLPLLIFLVASLYMTSFFVTGDKARFAGPSFSTMIFASFFLVVGYNIKGDDFNIELWGKRFSLWVVPSFCFGYLSFLALLKIGGYDFYPSFDCQVLFIPLLYFIFKRKYIKFTLVLLLMFLSGKRGPFLAALLATASYGVFLNRKLPLKYLLSGAVGGVLLVLIASASNFPTLEKYRNLFDAESSSTVGFWSQVTAGRNMEIMQALEKLNDNQSWLLGEGLGFGYDVLDQSGEAVEKRGYVHVSPLNFIFRHGVVLGVFIILLVYAVPFYKIFRLKRLEGAGVVFTKFISLVFVFTSVNSLFAYTIAYEWLFWFSLGNVYAINSRIRG